jgi:hypothetical protein
VLLFFRSCLSLFRRLRSGLARFFENAPGLLAIRSRNLHLEFERWNHAWPHDNRRNPVGPQHGVDRRSLHFAVVVRRAEQCDHVEIGRFVQFPSEDDREELEDGGGEQGSNRIAWFITGALIGATIAILYAPKSGQHTRQFIVDKTQQSKETVSGTTKDIADASREMFDRGRKVVEDAAELFDRARKLVRG